MEDTRQARQASEEGAESWRLSRSATRHPLHSNESRAWDMSVHKNFNCQIIWMTQSKKTARECNWLWNFQNVDWYTTVTLPVVYERLSRCGVNLEKQNTEVCVIAFVFYFFTRNIDTLCKRTCLCLFWLWKEIHRLFTMMMW